MRARVARGDDAEARADAEGKLQEDENQRLCIVYARHIGGGQRLAYDRRVADGVYLLQQVGQDDGQRKAQNGAPAAALGQIHGFE